MRHHEVDVRVVGEEGDPVGVGAGPVLGRAIDVEEEAVDFGVASARDEGAGLALSEVTVS